MAAAAPIMMGVGGLMSAVGAVKQGNDNAQMAEYNAAVARKNAMLVIDQGEEQARRSLVQSRKMVGGEAASYAASGVSPDGSAQWVMRESAAQGALNALTIRQNAQIKASGLRGEADLDITRAGNARTAGTMGAVGSLLGAGSRIGGMFGGGGGGGESGGEEDYGGEMA